MKLTKHLIVPVVALTLIGGTIMATNAVQAQSRPVQLGMDSIIQKLAQRFNLKEADVKAVFDEQQAEMEAQMHQRMEAELDQAVADGKLTEEQKQKIIAKRAEMKAAHQDKVITFKEEEKPSEEELKKFKAERDQEMAELKQWAQDNNVPFEYLMPKMFVKHIRMAPGAAVESTSAINIH